MWWQDFHRREEIKVTESAPIQSIVVLDPSQMPAVRELAAAHGVEAVEIPQHGIEPVTTVTLLLVGAAAAVHAVLHLVQELVKGGQVIDLRPDAPKAFYRTRDVMYGIVIIIAVDGKVIVTVKNPGGMFGKVISALPQLLPDGGSTKQVIEVATKTFGDDVQTDAAGDPAKDGDV
jgi:hypothetical protein